MRLRGLAGLQKARVEKNYPATPQSKYSCGFAGVVAGWQDNFAKPRGFAKHFMKPTTENNDGHRLDDDAEIRIPNSPVFASLERRSDGFYCKLLSIFGPCPVPSVKMKAQSWEQARADAKAMLTETRHIAQRVMSETLFDKN